MTREEMWEEFESQLISEVRTPITMSYNDSIRVAEIGIKEVAKKWKKRLEQEPKWIPVSERLPKKNMACLVAVGKFNLTQMAMYSDLMETIDHRIFYQGDYGHENFVDITQYVIAWMPLPKPYEPQESEDKNNG